MNALRFAVLLALVVGAAPAADKPEGKTVLVKPFNVPEAVHDGLRWEVARWPGLLAGSSKAGDPVRFVSRGKAHWVLTGRGRVVDEGKKFVLSAELSDSRNGERVWSGSYALTDVTKKVPFLADARKKIEAGVRASLNAKR